jgi:hypothetical protein
METEKKSNVIFYLVCSLFILAMVVIYQASVIDAQRTELKKVVQTYCGFKL